jgi:hypothetical protein
VAIIFPRRGLLVFALCLSSSFGPSRPCSGSKSPDSQHEVPRFSPSVFHMEFVVDKMTVRKVYFRLFKIFVNYYSTSAPLIYIYQPILDIGSVEITNKMQPCNIIYYSKVY